MLYITSIKDDFILLTQSVFILSWGKFDHNSLTLITETPCDPEKPVWPTKSPDMRFLPSSTPLLHVFLPPSPPFTPFPFFSLLFCPHSYLLPYPPLSLPPSLHAPSCSIFHTLSCPFTSGPILKGLYKPGNCSATEICTQPALKGTLLLVISKIIF